VRLSQIRDFIAVVEAGSLRSAARNVGVSQPAMSKSIQGLEQELHVQLLQRNTRGAAATPAGRAFLARARVIQSELRRAGEDLAEFNGGGQPAVAFGIAPAACMLVVPDAFTNFRSTFPSAQLRVVEGSSSALVAQVRDEILDFCVSPPPLESFEATLKFRPLYKPRLAVIARRGHPLRNARSIEDLAGASWLMFYPQQSGGGMLKKLFSRAGLDLPKSLLHCESYATALALVAKTDVLALLVEQTLDEPWGRYIEKIQVKESIPAPVLGIYTRADAPLTPAANTMALAVTAVARRLARQRGAITRP
jgi:LysR family transcriptional regulator of abg operon